MKEAIVELYGDEDLARFKRQIRQRRIAHAALAAVALAACIAMVALANTGNATRMELSAVAVSTLSGWIILYGSIFTVAARRRELAHATMLRSGERQAVHGAVTVTEERVVIRRSITARRVEVRDEGETHRLLVCESRAAALAASGATTVYAVHSYVAAYEVTP